ncbi:hypothetical protein GCM10010174_10130 [Kutzneria viridogrisea]|uniref:Antitoxin component YwqK of YwqJK toxin-antitoxin module n=1 Tax=Kutzneria viridogrisea TaxID=47990 RepID=A0ABR6BIB9_9PSEU|nr:antitoxin component YwqK of YwqJK toxin-antitoxin module [Kutzneria viridogrisea]
MRVNRDETEMTPGLVVVHNGQPFTGELVDVAADGTVTGLTTYRDGIEDGPQWERYPDGRPQLEGQCDYGSAVGEWREWHPNGQLSEHTVFDRWGDVRRRQRWDEDGTLTDDETSDGAHGGEW